MGTHTLADCIDQLLIQVYGSTLSWKIKLTAKAGMSRCSKDDLYKATCWRWLSFETNWLLSDWGRSWDRPGLAPHSCRPFIWKSMRVGHPPSTQFCTPCSCCSLRSPYAVFCPCQSCLKLANDFLSLVRCPQEANCSWLSLQKPSCGWRPVAKTTFFWPRFPDWRCLFS